MTESNTEHISNMIRSWAQAISSGDREGILAHHSQDILMFDFPPHIVRNISEYNQTWDFFYDSPLGKISFTPREIEVTAGEEVAFATCQIHCDGTSAGPLDLRLTVGLRKIDGDWVIIHEHHSIPTTEERFLPPTSI